MLTRHVTLSLVLAGMAFSATTAAQGQQLSTVIICVQDQSRAPIPNADVRVIPAPEPEPGKMRTDSKGELLLHLKVGGHGVFVSSQGFFSSVQHLEVKGNPEPQRFYTILRVASGGGPVEVDSTPGPHFVLDAEPYHEPWTLTRADLTAMPRTSIVIRDAAHHRKQTYSGVRMFDLLQRAGAPLGKEFYGIALLTSVTASGYVPGMKQSVEVVYALAEFEPTSNCGEFILADTVDGHPLGPEEAPFLLISSADGTRKRWVPGVQWMMFHPGLDQPVGPRFQ